MGYSEMLMIVNDSDYISIYGDIINHINSAQLWCDNNFMCNPGIIQK